MIPPTDGEGNLDVVDNTWTRATEDHLIKSGGNTPYEDKGDDYTADDDPDVGTQTGGDFLDELTSEAQAAKEGTGTPVGADENNFTTTTTTEPDNSSSGSGGQTGGSDPPAQSGGGGRVAVTVKKAAKDTNPLILFGGLAVGAYALSEVV